MRMNWQDNPEASELLSRLWVTDKALADIVAELQRELRCRSLTKSAVCGQARRLKLPVRQPNRLAPIPRPRKPKPEPEPKQLPIPVEPATAEPPPPPLPPPLPPQQTRPIPHAQKCQWPFGEPGRQGFHFCGDPALDSKPYCETHYRIAYTKQGRP